jgi:hypothetical protein
MNNLAETQMNIDINDLDEKSEETKKEVDGDVYNNTTDKIEVHDNNEEEENEHIKMYEDYEKNSPHENEEHDHEAEVEDEIYYVSIVIILFIF